jgi:hypothetical protein
MSSMAESTHTSSTQDICVLLRIHGEEHWLTTEVLPVVRELESPHDVAQEQLGAALAYLEVLWLDALRRAAETDAACATLTAGAQRDRVLFDKTRRYHAAVRRLRSSLGHRVVALTRCCEEPLEHVHAHR